MKSKILSVVFLGISKKVYDVLQRIQEEGYISMEVSWIAYDEEKAKEYVIEKKPDLIVIEIIDTFPVWNFMDEIYSEENHVDVLLTSKEKKFEYAYQAFQHHALNFLLEPIDEKIIIQCLWEVNKKKQFIEEINEDRKKLDSYELKQHQDLMERILSNILEKPEELELLIGEVNQRYQTQLQNNLFQALVVIVDKRELFYEKTGFCQKILNYIENAFPYSHEVLGSVLMPYGITGIINFSSTNSLQEEKSHFYQLYQKILELQHEYGEFHVAIGVGAIVSSMKEVNISLEEAFRAGLYRLVRKDKQIFYADELLQENKSFNEVISIALQKALIRYLKNMETEHLMEWFNQVIKISECEFRKFPQGYLSLKDFMIQTAKDVWGEKDKYFAEEESFFNKLDYIFEGKKILELLKESLLRICEKRKQFHQEEVNVPIQKAMDYIEMNYGEAITLEELANSCGLSPNYFSAMFKEQVGETYIDYLTGFRLEQSTQLLIETKKTIKEIAKEIGYLDDKYFRKLFKSRYGMTPSTYRLNKLK